MIEFRTSANPLICAAWSRETLISRLSMAPFADVPRKTAGGVGALDDKACGATGTMPKACSVGNDDTGSCTGIAVDVIEVAAVGIGIYVSEAGVIGDVVVEVEVEPLVEAVAVDGDLVAGIVVARAGGIYCVMVELRGTE
jgi:hypothetical protein